MPSNRPIVPDEFDVPKSLECEGYRLRVLTVDDVVADYDAVMMSAEHIQQTVWPGSPWPTGLTLRQNLVDLGWHEKEFQRRASFAYTVVESDESRVIGCVYLYPTSAADFDVVVPLWTRPPEQLTFLDEDTLYATVSAWIAEYWPFERPAYPGFNISHEDWQRLRD